MTSMELREIAERILHGPTLADKLFRPSAVTDQRPGSARETPEAPARDVALVLNARARESNPFPKDQELSTESARADVLHAFANHELLAIELMAAMLLRFPDAPTRLRLGLMATLRDEQVHLSLYLERLKAVGLSFGERPVSGFFWTILRQVPDLRGFLAGMSLGFEQANLDFSRHYAELFRRLGDDATASVLKRVHDDEIRHVRQGARWLRRLEPSIPLLDAWRQWLPAGLHPAFARGRGFDREARLKAGLDAPYVNAVEASGAARGKPAELFFLNPDCEGELTRSGAQPAAVRAIESDLEILAGFLASRTDAVIVRKELDPPFVRALEEVSLELPERVVVRELDGGSTSDVAAGLARAWRQRGHRGISPWAKTPRVAIMEAAIAAFQSGTPSTADEAVFRCVASKGFTAEVAAIVRREVAADPAPLGKVVTSADGWRAAIEACAAAGYSRSVSKSLFGSAGRGHHFVDGSPDDHDLSWLNAATTDHQGVVVEPWLPRVVDFSFHFTLASERRPRFDGVTRFLTTAAGGFMGAVLVAPLQGLTLDLKRWITLEHGGLKELGKRLLVPINASLKGAGFFGQASIDTLIYRTDEGFRLRPLVEINPRPTMGRIALHLGRAIAPRTTAVWLHLSRGRLNKSGLTNFSELASALRGGNVVKDGRLVHGAVFTTPPESARTLITVIVAGDAIARVAELVPSLSDIPGFDRLR